MIGLILDRLLKTGKLRDTIVRHSFFLFNGIVGSIILNDLLLLLYGDDDGKHDLQYILSTAIIAGPLVSPKFTILGNYSNNIMLGSGFFLGTYLSNRSEHKEGLPI